MDTPTGSSPVTATFSPETCRAGIAAGNGRVAKLAGVKVPLAGGGSEGFHVELDDLLAHVGGHVEPCERFLARAGVVVVGLHHGYGVAHLVRDLV